MLPLFRSGSGGFSCPSSPVHSSLLTARRGAAALKSRRRLGPALPALALCLGIMVLGYEAWYAVATISANSGSSGFVGDSRGRGRLPRRQLGQQPLAAQPQRTFPARHLKNLILVACHSVYTGMDFRNSDASSSWFLLDYQKVPGQTHSFVQHIQIGVEQAAQDPHALLLFSGGKTRREAGPRAEGEGYWMVAEAAGWYGHEGVRDRSFTEDHARDSFENLLFSLCRFYELTGHYPESITVVGYEFKRSRFMELHRAAVGFPLERFSYAGTPALTKGALQGEAKTVAAFRLDPYGCNGELAAKRVQRDPFSHGGLTPDRCPDMGGLLLHCGPGQYEGMLPWDDWKGAETGAGGASWAGGEA